MKKLTSVVVAMAIVFILVVIEIVVIRSAGAEVKTATAVFAAKDIGEGMVITGDMIKVKKVNADLLTPSSVKYTKDIMGKTAVCNLSEGEIIFTGNISDGREQAAVENPENRLFSLELKGDQANGWWLHNGQYVDIVYVPDRQGQQDMGASTTGDGNFRKEIQKKAGISTDVQMLMKVRIAAIIDENGRLLKDKEREGVPKYISFELSCDDAVFLAAVKDKGRLELAVIP